MDQLLPYNCIVEIYPLLQFSVAKQISRYNRHIECVSKHANGARIQRQTLQTYLLSCVIFYIAGGQFLGAEITSKPQEIQNPITK